MAEQAMAESIAKWDETKASTRMRRRRRWKMVLAGLAGVVLISIVADHLRAKNRGDDWVRFDGRTVRFVRAVDGCSIAVSDADSDDVTVVGVLGIRAARESRWNHQAADRVEGMLKGKSVTLHLRAIAPRDSIGRVRADVFLNNGELLAADLAGDGLVVVDRRDRGDFFTDITRTQAVARRKHLGLWRAESGD
jgi:endonuclease YncB( thermonuclease family)